MMANSRIKTSESHVFCVKCWDHFLPQSLSHYLADLNATNYSEPLRDGGVLPCVR